MATVTDLKRRMAFLARWMVALEDGLNGNPQSLGQGEGEAMEKALAKVGVRLLSKTKASKEGLELRRGAKPIVRRHYGAPISDWKGLYCLEQFKEAAQNPGAESATAGQAQP